MQRTASGCKAHKQNAGRILVLRMFLDHLGVAAGGANFVVADVTLDRPPERRPG